MYFAIWLLRFPSAEESSRTLGLVLVGDAAVEFYRPGAVPDGLELQLFPETRYRHCTGNTKMQINSRIYFIVYGVYLFVDNLTVILYCPYYKPN